MLVERDTRKKLYIWYSACDRKINVYKTKYIYNANEQQQQQSPFMKNSKEMNKTCLFALLLSRSLLQIVKLGLRLAQVDWYPPTLDHKIIDWLKPYEREIARKEGLLKTWQINRSQRSITLDLYPSVSSIDISERVCVASSHVWRNKATLRASFNNE